MRRLSLSMSPNDRQRVERVAGSRRARLTPVPGTDSSAESTTEERPAPIVGPGGGPNDERLLRDVPPHY